MSSFKTIDSKQKKIQVMKDFVANRRTIKERQLQEKLGEQAIAEVSEKMQAPVVKTIKEIDEQNKTAYDKRQDQLILKLDEGQTRMTGALKGLTTAVQHIPELKQAEALQAIEQLPRIQPEELDEEAIVANPDKDLDPEVIAELGFHMPSKLLEKSEDELKELKKKIGKFNMTHSKWGKASAEQEDQNKLKHMKAYLGRVTQILNAKDLMTPSKKSGKGRKLVPSPVYEEMSGPKNISKSPYKLTKNYTFGELDIDEDKLAKNKLEAYKGEKKVISRKFDSDFLELLTKRYDTRKEYSHDSLELFSKLISLSGLPINSRSMKFNKIIATNPGVIKTGGCRNEIKYYSSPDKLVSRLGLLVSSKQSGNKGKCIDNEIMEISTKLYNDGVISKEEYRDIFDKYIS